MSRKFIVSYARSYRIVNDRWHFTDVLNDYIVCPVEKQMSKHTTHSPVALSNGWIHRKSSMNIGMSKSGSYTFFSTASMKNDGENKRLMQIAPVNFKLSEETRRYWTLTPLLTRIRGDVFCRVRVRFFYSNKSSSTTVDIISALSMFLTTPYVVIIVLCSAERVFVL